MNRSQQDRWIVSRRVALLGLAAAAIPAGRAFGMRTGQDPAETSDPIDLIRKRLADVGIAGPREVESEHYVAIGTARDDFMEEALRLCEGLFDDYLAHFGAKGFAADVPADRLAVAILDDDREFARLLGADEVPNVTGLYEVGPNYLVLYDGRNGGPAAMWATRANSVTLFHEATHQLTFNTGLLDPTTEIPLLVSEGLAIYGEVRRPDGRTRIGAPNRERLAVIGDALRRGQPLIAAADLIANDAPFRDPDRVQLAYAQSWLVVFGMIQGRQASERFRSYLQALRTGGPNRDPVGLAGEHLGDLGQLDQDVLGLAHRLLRIG